MPFDPTTNTWKYEDDSVEGKVTGLVDVNSPLIQQARTQGMQAANRRGLANSSIAVGASQDAAYKAALPIATQDATQTYGKNKEMLDEGNREKLTVAQGDQTVRNTGLQTASSEKIAGMQTETQKYIAEQEMAAAGKRLETQLSSQEKTNAANIEAAKNLQLARDAAEKDRLGLQLTSAEKIALSNQLAEKERLGQTLTSQEKQTLDRLNADKAIATDRNKTDTTNTAVQVQAQRDANVASAVNVARSNYTSLVNTITANTNIPADGPGGRAALLNNAAKAYESDIKAIAALYNVPIPIILPGTVPVDPTAPGGGGTGPHDPNDPRYVA